jgi:hypothetical protein
MAFKHRLSLRRTRLILSIFTITSALALTSIGVVNAADAPGTKGPIGTTGKTTTGVTGPVKGSTPTKLKSDIIVINAPVKKVVGQAGAQGSQGLVGAQGLQGEQGDEGEEGMVGPQGPEGLQGIQGIQGVQGIQGPVGAQGPRGDSGSQGPKGDTGPQGPQGPAGRDGTSGGGGGGGADGAAATIAIGTVETGSAAAVTNSGTSNAAVLNFVFPSGSSGPITNNNTYYSNTFGSGAGATTADNVTTCAEGKKFSSVAVIGSVVSITCTTDATSTGSGSFDAGSVDDTTACSSYGVIGLSFTDPKIKPVCATSMPSAITTALSAMQGVITIAAPGTYSSGGCSSGKAVRKLTLVSGTLTYECGSTGSSDESDFEDLSVEKETDGEDFSSSEKCSSGDAVRGLKFNDSGELSFLCESVGSSSSPTPMPLPTFNFSGSSSVVSVTTGASAAVSYNGTKFSIVIPSGILGSTISLGNSECDSTDKVSKITLNSGVLSVVCDSDETAPISSVSVSPTSAGSSPTVSWSSSNKRLSFVIPTGASGSPGPSGSPGSKGDAGNDGKTPVIAVNPTIGTGSPRMAVATSSPSGNPTYTFTLTLPAIPSGYEEMKVCVKKSDGSMYLKNSCSDSYNSYTVLVKD